MMNNYIFINKLLSDNKLDLTHIIYYYISYISVFYCKNIQIDDVLKDKINDIQTYIDDILKEDDKNV